MVEGGDVALEIPVPLLVAGTGVDVVSEFVALPDVMEVTVDVPVLAVLVIMGVGLEEPVSGEFEDEKMVLILRVTVEVKVEIGVELMSEESLETVTATELPGVDTSVELAEAVVFRPVVEAPGTLEVMGSVIVEVKVPTVSVVVPLGETVPLEMGSVLLKPAVVLPG